MSKTHIKIINTTHPLYQQERILRNKILLRPIGIPDFGWEMNDANSIHIVACVNNEVIGCVLLHPQKEESDRAQLMQMAIQPSWQGNGIGKQLIKALIGHCQSNQITEVFCHSREDVVDFNKKLGFTFYGEPFEELGITHLKMKIQISRR